MAMQLSKAEFCPLCGVRSLERDWYRLTHTNKRGKKGLDPNNIRGKAPEFQCSTCNAAFMLSPSLRYEQAISIFSAHRKLGVHDQKRNGNEKEILKQERSLSPAEEARTIETREGTETA